MDDNRLDALAYPTTRRIAPVLGTNQIGSNAGLSAQTGFPAISVPRDSHLAVFRRPGAARPSVRRADADRARILLSGQSTAPSSGAIIDAATRNEGGRGRAHRDVRRYGIRKRHLHGCRDRPQSVPPSDVPSPLQHASTSTRKHVSSAMISLPAALLTEIAGVYLHRRANRPNGGVAHIVAKLPASSNSGRVTLSEQEANDLKAGKLYLAVVSRKSPRLTPGPT